MTKILLTGGAGYIGSHVLKQLLEANHEVVIIDNLSTGYKENILGGTHIEMDLSDHEKLEDIIKKEKFSACFHFAGSIVVPESIQDPLKYYKNNTLNSLRLIELCQKYSINKFIFSSTAAVYLPEDKSGICSESSSICPSTPYGHSKLMTETMLEDTSKAHPDFKYVIFRYFNVAGANVDGLLGQRNSNTTHLIKIASEVASGKRDFIEIYGTNYATKDGSCIRDFIHIDDLASAHIKGYDYLNSNGESDVFNCGYSQGYSVIEVIETMKKVSKFEFKTIIGTKRKGDLACVIADTKKITEKLNWRPKYNSLEMICKTSYEWEKKLS